jgi:L-alanine-DL-glutamate epimerase-like enolase superfamily enzyme
MARIEDVRATAYAIPTDRPESDGTLEWDSTTAVVVEVAAEGTRGIGYTYGHHAIAEVVTSALGPAISGADALAPPAAWASMQREARNLGRRGLCAMAISAVDIALWDLRAKLLGLSLADSLGRFHDAVPVYGSGGFTSYTEAELIEQLRDWVERGCRAVKIKVGREPERDPERLAAAREAIGDDKRRRLPGAKPAGQLAYLRLHYGHRGRDGNYSEAELDDWRRRIAAWRSRRPTFVYLNNDWRGYAPANARYLAHGLSSGGDG